MLRIAVEQASIRLNGGSLIHKRVVWIYVVVNVERIVKSNGLIGENYRRFGQIFAMLNLLSLLAVLYGYFMPSIILIRRSHARKAKRTIPYRAAA
jgi:hypothetical protein